MESEAPIDIGEKIRNDLAKFGIFGLYILTREGLPLVERNYKKFPGKTPKEEERTAFGPDSLLVAGFFSAIAKFASEKIRGLLSDIGLHTIRLFFDFTEDLIFILVFDELKLQMLPFNDIRTVNKGTVSQIKSIFETYFSDENPDGITTDIDRISENMVELERLRSSFIKLYPQIDKLIHKSYREISIIL